MDRADHPPSTSICHRGLSYAIAFNFCEVKRFRMESCNAVDSLSRSPSAPLPRNSAEDGEMTKVSRVNAFTAETRKLLSIVLAFALLAPCIASAADPDWQFVTVSDDRIVFVDTTTIRMHENRLTASVLYRFAATQTPLPGKTFQSSVYLVDFECASERSGFVSVANYAGLSGDGTLVDSFERTSQSVKMNYAAPRTLGHSTLQFVCSRASSAI